MANGLPIFFGDKEEALFKALGRELVEDLVNQHFTLFRIDVAKTESNFYGESKNKTYLPPLEIKGRIQIADVAVISEGGIRRMSKGDMKAGVYREFLEELDAHINVGDFIKFQGKVYEVYDAGYNLDSMDRKFAADRDYMWEILAKVVHEDVFMSIIGDVINTPVVVPVEPVCDGDFGTFLSPNNICDSDLGTF
jgi:hypothetical protein